MMRDISVSKKYARAFLNLYGNDITDKDCVSFEQAVEFFKQNSEFVFLLKLHYIIDQTKLEIMDKLIATFKLPEVIHRLVSVLLDDSRLYLLPDVLAWTIDLHRSDIGIELFNVASSHPLDKAEYAEIKKFLSDKIGKSIVIEASVESDLIAGLRMQSDYHLWEYSIRKQLQNIKKNFNKD